MSAAELDRGGHGSPLATIRRLVRVVVGLLWVLLRLIDAVRVRNPVAVLVVASRRTILRGSRGRSWSRPVGLIGIVHVARVAVVVIGSVVVAGIHVVVRCAIVEAQPTAIKAPIHRAPVPATADKAA